jgi:hypothetical protein
MRLAISAIFQHHHHHLLSSHLRNHIHAVSPVCLSVSFHVEYWLELRPLYDMKVFVNGRAG